MKFFFTSGYKTFLLIATLALLWSCGASAQNKNAYRFVEPCASIAYDSNRFETGEPFSAGLERTSYLFTMKGKDAPKIKILIKTNYKDPEVTQGQDSLLKEMEEKFKASLAADKSVAVVDKKTTRLREFSCFGVTGYEPANKKYSSTIAGVHIFETGFTMITLISDGQKDLSKNFEILDAFLSGYMFYTREKIDAEAEVIKKKYTVDVDSVALNNEEIQYMHSTWAGIVRLSPKPEHKIELVKLGTSIFSEESGDIKNDEIRIRCRDRERGKFTHTGSVVILNSFGKRVFLPFTFTYTNSKSDY